MTERQIIKGCKRRNEKAFRALVTQYAPMLSGVCRRYMGNIEDAEDVLQEVLIKVFKSIDQFRDDGAFGGWLRRIAVTTSLKALRKKRLITESLDDHGPSIYLEKDPEIELTQDAEEILAIIATLPVHYRVIFNLNIIEGYSHEEIAEMLEINSSTSRTRLTRARIMVKDKITKKNMTHEALETRRVHSK